MTTRPVGIFDSGIGGLTVLSAVARRLPQEKILYLGDTARVPYGTKSAATVSRYARQCAAFLCEQGIKALVVACNTASALAIDELRDMLGPQGIPVLGVIEPGAVEACRVSRFGRVGVIGTSSTIRSGAYERAIKTIKPDFSVTSAACPMFVPLAEEGWTGREDAAARGAAERYLGPLGEAGVDTLIMGCTHYPLLRDVIQDALAGVTLVESGEAVARDLERTLSRLGIAGGPARGGGAAEYFVTDDPERFREVGSRFLGHDIQAPRLAELGDLSHPSPHVVQERR